MKTRKPKVRKTVHLNIPDGLLEQLDKRAAGEKRTRINMIMCLLEKAIEDSGSTITGITIHGEKKEGLSA